MALIKHKTPKYRTHCASMHTFSSTHIYTPTATTQPFKTYLTHNITTGVMHGINQLRNLSKRCVFNWDVNWERVGRFLRLDGKEFQMSGAE